jgi:hypothetical protein
MKLAELLRDNRDAIVRRWLEDALAAYPDKATSLFARQQDPFANPVGASLRTGLAGIFAALLDGTEAAACPRHLEDIIRIRAVQQLSATEAVGFVLGLKDAIRAVLPAFNGDATLAADLAGFERRIDGVALAAFDVYARCREQVCELRVNEVKRRVAWVMERQNR